MIAATLHQCPRTRFRAPARRPRGRAAPRTRPPAGRTPSPRPSSPRTGIPITVSDEEEDDDAAPRTRARPGAIARPAGREAPRAGSTSPPRSMLPEDEDRRRPRRAWARAAWARLPTSSATHRLDLVVLERVEGPAQARWSGRARSLPADGKRPERHSDEPDGRQHAQVRPSRRGRRNRRSGRPARRSREPASRRPGASACGAPESRRRRRSWRTRGAPSVGLEEVSFRRPDSRADGCRRRHRSPARPASRSLGTVGDDVRRPLIHRNGSSH